MIMMKNILQVSAEKKASFQFTPVEFQRVKYNEERVVFFFSLTHLVMIIMGEEKEREREREKMSEKQNRKEWCKN